jgi:hypothetical protein
MRCTTPETLAMVELAGLGSVSVWIALAAVGRPTVLVGVPHILIGSNAFDRSSPTTSTRETATWKPGLLRLGRTRSSRGMSPTSRRTRCWRSGSRVLSLDAFLLSQWTLDAEVVCDVLAEMERDRLRPPRTIAHAQACSGLVSLACRRAPEMTRAHHAHATLPRASPDLRRRGNAARREPPRRHRSRCTAHPPRSRHSRRAGRRELSAST